MRPAPALRGRRKGLVRIWDLHLGDRNAVGLPRGKAVSSWKGLHYRYDPPPKLRPAETIEPGFLPRSLNDAHRASRPRFGRRQAIADDEAPADQRRLGHRQR